MTDEHFIFKGHAFANESVARDFASVANPHSLLDFHEGADLDVIADFAPVEIGKGEHLDSLAKLHIRSDALKELVWNVHSSHRQDASATRGGDTHLAIAIPVAVSIAGGAVAVPMAIGTIAVPIAINPMVAVLRGR